MNETNKKILIADDDKGFSMILKSRLTDAGFNILVANNGQEALALLKNEKPDLVLLDIMMPQMNGIEVAKKIRENKSNVIIIFLTALSDISHINDAIQSDPSDYVIKSELSVEEIVEKVKIRLNVK